MTLKWLEVAILNEWFASSSMVKPNDSTDKVFIC